MIQIGTNVAVKVGPKTLLGAGLGKSVCEIEALYMIPL